MDIKTTATIDKIDLILSMFAQVNKCIYNTYTKRFYKKRWPFPSFEKFFCEIIDKDGSIIVHSYGKAYMASKICAYIETETDKSVTLVIKSDVEAKSFRY